MSRNQKWTFGGVLMALCFWAMSCGREKKPIVILQAPKLPASADYTVRKEVRALGFGSCANPSTVDSMPILRQAADMKLDVFTWLGDNVYGDTENMDTLQKRYQELAAANEFQALKARVRLMATWDDHDFGANDAGRHYPQKDSSKLVFLDFWEEPMLSPRRRRAGIYTSTLYDGARLDLHVIVLDTRTFRDDLIPATGMELLDDQGLAYTADWVPHSNPDSTLLGAAQWTWLENNLEVPCDVRVICTSTQFGVGYNGYESWANWPDEQRKMIALLERDAEWRQGTDVKVPITIFVSGDVHYAEASTLTTGADGLPISKAIQPLWDITSSGITSTWPFATQNINRRHGPIMENNFGVLRFLPNDSTMVSAEIHDVSGAVRIQQAIGSR